MRKTSRRSFLGQAAAAAPGVAALSAATALGAQPAPPAHAGRPSPSTRRCIPGGPNSPFSRAVLHGDVAHVSGVLGTRPGTWELVSAEFEPQCRQVLENLKASVEAAGSTMARVLRCTVFLTRADDFKKMNEIYMQYFPSDRPARSTVVVKELVVPGATIEIDCVTAVG